MYTAALGLSPAGLVSAVRLHDVRGQLPVRLVRRLFHRRTLPDDPVPAQAPGDLSTGPRQGGRRQPGRSRPRSLQLRHLDVRRRADRRAAARQTLLPGARSLIFHCYAQFTPPDHDQRRVASDRRQCAGMLSSLNNLSSVSKIIKKVANGLPWTVSTENTSYMLMIFLIKLEAYDCFQHKDGRKTVTKISASGRCKTNDVVHAVTCRIFAHLGQNVYKHSRPIRQIFRRVSRSYLMYIYIYIYTVIHNYGNPWFLLYSL